jgi:hypothetical protein
MNPVHVEAARSIKNAAVNKAFGLKHEPAHTLCAQQGDICIGALKIFR